MGKGALGNGGAQVAAGDGARGEEAAGERTRRRGLIECGMGLQERAGYGATERLGEEESHGRDGERL